MPDPKPFTPLPPQPESIPLHMDFKAVWAPPSQPEDFMFPYVETEVSILDNSTGELTKGSMRTLGSHDPSDIFVNLCNNMVHQKMFPGIHKRLFTALQVIIHSEDYQREHDAWRAWKGKQPKAFHVNINKRAAGFDLTAQRNK